MKKKTSSTFLINSYGGGGVKRCGQISSKISDHPKIIKEHSD
jgi:hypothetical protein